MNLLIPHTDQWFVALDKANADQAAITRQIIELAGRSDACSICGDVPALDYQVVGRMFSDDIGATIRLCDDCREIQRDTNGESYVRMTA